MLAPKFAKLGLMFAATVAGSAFLTGCLGPAAQVLNNTPDLSVSATPFPSCKTELRTATNDFNVLVFNNFTAPSSDIEGRLAAGGDVNIASYSVGAKLAADATRADIVVGHNLTFNGGDVPNGRILYGNAINMQSATSLGEPAKESPISFSAASLELKAMSQALAKLTANGQVQKTTYGGRLDLQLNALDATVNVFSVQGSDLANTHTLTISGSASTSVVINVSGTAASLASMGMFLAGGITHDHVIFNFFEAQTLSVRDIQVEGSVLAPLASLNFPHGLIVGQVVAASSNGAGQFNHAPYSGCLPIEHSLAFVKDASMDSTDLSLTGGTQYELYGMAVRQIGDYVIIAMNGNLPPAGVNEVGVHIGWGDLIMNFSSDLSSWTHDVVGKTYAVHFEPNGSSITANGLYRNVTTGSVESSHSGWTSWASYTSWVVNQGQIVGLGNVDLSYFPSAPAMPNVIGSGTLVNTAEFQMLSASDLGSLGIDFPAAFHVSASQLGSQTVGFVFKRPSDMKGSYVMHVAPDCANDAMAIKFRLE